MDRAVESFFSCPQVGAFLNVIGLLLKFISFFTKVRIKPKKLAGHSVVRIKPKKLAGHSVK